MIQKKKIIISMSGGVDSSVCAWILKKSGYHVEGLFMKNWEEDDYNDMCIAKKDFLDAKKVCKKIKIFLHTANFSIEYWNKVFKIFLSEYKKGNTPNPDILCNQEIKFKVFLKYAIKHLHADYIATGHYVRKKQYRKKYQLFRSISYKDDQSYFLYTINQNILKKCIFPIGNLTKKKVRKIAKKIGLHIADKKGSTGICFIGKKKFNHFLTKYIKPIPGKIITDTYKTIGKHPGIIYYTLGQRKGISINKKKNNNKPWYVIKKHAKKNFLMVSQNKYHKKLLFYKFKVKKLFWINQKKITQIIKCNVTTRYKQKLIQCIIKPIKKKLLKVKTYQQIYNITPGQSAVFYINQRCLGGGIII